jgi:hypothetical protein
MGKTKIGVDMDTIDELFCGQFVDVLISYHENLLKAVEDISFVATSTAHIEIGRVFLEWCPYLKSYAEFCSQYEQNMELLLRLRRQEKKFDAFVRKLETGLDKNMELQWLMIEPVQRLPRYMILLDRLVVVTCRRCGTCKLCQALSEVKRTLSRVNERVRESESRREVLNLQSKLQFADSAESVKLVAPHRFFLMQYDCQLQIHRDNDINAANSSSNSSSSKKNAFESSTPGHVAVFNDTLLLCTFQQKKKKETTLQFVGLLPLVALDIIKLGSGSTENITTDGSEVRIRSGHRLYCITLTNPACALDLYTVIRQYKLHGLQRELQRFDQYQITTVQPPTSIGIGINPGAAVVDTWDNSPITCPACMRFVSKTEMFVQVEDRYYHTNCATCLTCDTLLADGTTPYTHGGKLYCEEDYRNLFLALNLCPGCKEPVMGDYMALEGGRYHSECVKCQTCAVSLLDEPCYMENHALFCGKHYIQGPCCVCQEPVHLAGGISLSVTRAASSQNYICHLSCYKCKECQVSLENSTAYPHEECPGSLTVNLYCLQHVPSVTTETKDFPSCALCACLLDKNHGKIIQLGEFSVCSNCAVCSTCSVPAWECPSVRLVPPAASLPADVETKDSNVPTEQFRIVCADCMTHETASRAVASQTCGSCHKALDSVSCFLLNAVTYHLDCVICVRCGDSLLEAPSVALQGCLSCESCARKLLMLPKSEGTETANVSCGRCHDQINDVFWIDEALDAYVHPYCYKS